MSISTALEPFKGAAKIILNEKFIDDKGAKEVANFLESHGRVEFLELKSNDITGVGFGEIFKSLLKNPNLRQLSIEHNRLGEEEDDDWPTYFSELISRSTKIERINFSNNKLGRRGFSHIKQAVSNSESVKLVEIKYNQIPTEEISSFVSELKNNNNQTLLFVELSGNKIEKEVINELETYLKANREINPVSKDSLMMTGGFFNNSRPNQTVTSFTRTNAIDELSKENVIRHLEGLLDENRKGTTEMRNKLEEELGELQRREKLDGDEIANLDKKCSELIISNRNMKYELDKTVQEHQQIERDIDYEARVREERIMQANKELSDMQSKYEEIENKMNRDHDYKMKEIARNWEARLRSVDERIRDIENDSNAVDNEIRKIVQKREKQRVEYEEEERLLRQRIEEEETQKYRFKLQALESRISEVEESREKYLTRGQDVLYEFDTIEKDGSKEINDHEEELKVLKGREDNLVNKNKSLLTKNEGLKFEIGLKEVTVEKLEEEINRLNEEIELRKVHNRQQIDKIIADHEYDRSKKSEEKSNDIQKINELEKTLRNYQLENAKLEQEYMILEQRLQSTLSKAVQEVFSQNNLY